VSRKKSGVCKCGHEIKRWHTAEGVCTYGDGTLHGARCAIEHGGQCSPKSRGKAEMNGTSKQVTRAVTVDGERIAQALRVIRGAHLMIAEEIGALLAEIARGKISKEVPAMLAAPVERPAEEARGRTNTNGTAAAGARTHLATGGADSELGAGPLALLLAIAQWGDPTPEVLVLATGYRATSVQTYLGELSSRALITREAGRSQVTSDGTDVLTARFGAPFPGKPMKRTLLERWISDFGDGPAAILRAIAEAGRPVTPGELLERVPYKATSIQTYLVELSRPHVIKRAGGRAWLHPELGGPS